MAQGPAANRPDVLTSNPLNFFVTKKNSLAFKLGMSVDDIEELGHEKFRAGEREYVVLDSFEAESLAFEIRRENLDTVISDIGKENYKYFDYRSYMDFAKNANNFAKLISADGEEIELGGDLYAYRTA